MAGWLGAASRLSNVQSAAPRGFSPSPWLAGLSAGDPASLTLVSRLLVLIVAVV